MKILTAIILIFITISAFAQYDENAATSLISVADENNDGNMVTRAVKKFTNKESGEHARKRRLARGAQKGSFFGLEKFVLYIYVLKFVIQIF